MNMPREYKKRKLQLLFCGHCKRVTLEGRLIPIDGRMTHAIFGVVAIQWHFFDIDCASNLKETESAILVNSLVAYSLGSGALD